MSGDSKASGRFAMSAAFALAASLGAAGAASAEPATIAVMPFDYTTTVRTTSTLVRQGEGGRTWVLTTKEDMTVELETHEFTNKLITALVKENKFSVVERQKLDRLIEEQKLGASGLADPARAAQMGKLLGADYFIMTEISVFDGSAEFQYFKFVDRYNCTMRVSLIVDVRVVNTSTGKIVYAEKVDASREWKKDQLKERVAGRVSKATVDEIERDLCQKMVRGVVDTVFPIKVIKWSSGVAYLNRGSNGGVVVGNVYRVVDQGEELVDEDTGLVLGAEETDTAIIEVTETQKKFSKARVVRWLGGASEIANGSICRPFKGEVPAPPPPPPPPRDMTPPTLRIVSPPDGALLGSNPVTVVVESPDSDVASVTINGAPASGSGGRFTATITGAEGGNRIEAVALDEAGNAGRAEGGFVLDTTPPSLRFLAPKAGSTVSVNPVNVWVESPDASSVTINGSPAESKGEGRWSATVTVSEGKQTLRAIAVDAVGNAAEATLSFNFDSTPPEVSAEAEVLIKGKVDDPSSTVTVNGKPVKVNPDGTYETRVKLGADRKVTIIATDEFGNAKKIVKQY